MLKKGQEGEGLSKLLQNRLHISLQNLAQQIQED